MTSLQTSERLCETCKKDAVKTKAQIRCFECRYLLCESCSLSHLEANKDHHLLDLVQFTKKATSNYNPSTSKQTSTSSEENNLTFQFLEHGTLSENTILYRGAQVAVESGASKQKTPTSKQVYPRREYDASIEQSRPAISKETYPRREKATLSEQSGPQPDLRRLKATKCLEFSVGRPEDKVDIFVTGVLCLSDFVVVVDHDNIVLKLFDHNGTYLSSTDLKDHPWGITCVHDSTFATCGDDNTLNLWTVRGQNIVSEAVCHVDYIAQGIDYNGTYYCVLHRDINSVTILNKELRYVKKIDMKEAFGKKFSFGLDIHMDTNNIYVSCNDEHGVLCMTIYGEAMWFTPLSCSSGITEIHGTLCVADWISACLHLITKEGEYVMKLLDKDNLGGRPFYVCNGQNGKLCVSCHTNVLKRHSFSNKRDKISVYMVA